jgi:hypothetical protein
MGLPPITCICNKSCNDIPSEFDFKKQELFGEKNGNTKTDFKYIETNSKSKTRSSLFKPYKLEEHNSSGNNNDYVKEKGQPPLKEVGNIYNDEIKNKHIKSLMTFEFPKEEISEEQINIENSEKDKNNQTNKEIKEFQINPHFNDIKYIPNFDKTFFYSKKLKNAEKNFRNPLNYLTDYQKYYKEDDDNMDMLVLINTMNNNKGVNHTEKDGIVMEYRGEKFLYIGETDKNQLPTGFGILYTQGQRYEGNFFRGKLTGLGRYINEEGTCFEGIFEDNKLVSKATIITINENNKRVEYFGEVFDFKKNGKGEEICEDEYIYTGDFSNDMKHGKGRLEYIENGELYDGQFDKGEINGKGLYIWSNGEEYEGDFVKGIKHGKGKYTWPDGCIYEGEYNNGIREGKGKYFWEDGRIFIGRFKDGKPDGKGKIYYKGKSYKCEYRNGTLISDIYKLVKKS